MQRFILVLGTLVALFIGPSAFAAIQYKTYLDPEASNSPTIISCTAHGTSGQRCRMCWQNFAPDGETSLGWVCKYVAQDSACTCKSQSYFTDDCKPEGRCYYL